MKQQANNKINYATIMVPIIVIVVVLLGVVLFVNNNKSGSNNTDQQLEGTGSNVSMVDGTQVIEISARGGYSPQKSVAKANVPTVINFKTKGTFDCSTAVRIPSLNVSKNLPRSGETEVAIGPQPAGKLSGSCSMGMYFFEIDFQT